jgi:transposase InsO family protein
MPNNPTQNEQLAYFRYAVIAPLLPDEPERTLRERIGEQADRLWTLPDGRIRRYSFDTIERWLYDYRRGGIELLRHRPRKDIGTFRGIDEALGTVIDELLAKHPSLRTHAVIDHLRREDLLGHPPPGTSTLYRYIKASRPVPTPAPPEKERRCFEAPFAGSLWQADIMYGPHLPQKLVNDRAKLHQTYLVAIIDDHSRLICHAQFFFKQDLAAWLSCLKTAICKRGIPQRLYCDNGQVFTSDQVKQITAELGIELLHTKVRDAAAKGKIEKWFLRCRRSFVEPTFELKAPKTLEQLNELLYAWVEDEYNHRVHSAFNDTPVRRFMESSGQLRQLTEQHQKLFHVRHKRKVKKDGTFQLLSCRFEISSNLAGQTITATFDLFDPLTVYVYHQGNFRGKATLLDAQANANRRRR